MLPKDDIDDGRQGCQMCFNLLCHGIIPYILTGLRSCYVRMYDEEINRLI